MHSITVSHSLRKRFSRAIPTRYKSIEFRSRSEARFARHLDLLCRRSEARCWWEYEPVWAKTDSGYTPDFALVYEPRDRVVLVELKPERPTVRYRLALYEEFRTLADRFVSSGRGIEGVLVVGGFWKNDWSSSVLVATDDQREGQTYSGIEGDALVFGAEVMSYRFDLAVN